MRNNRLKPIIAVLVVVLLAAVVLAVDFLPRGDINMKNIWSLKNAPWVNGSNAFFSGNVTASYFIGDGSQLTGLANVSTATVNHSNSTNYWDSLNSPLNINQLGALNTLDVNGATDIAGPLVLHSNLDMNGTNITGVDWLFVHNISGYSPITINSNLLLGSNNITGGFFMGDGSLLSNIAAAWTSITGRPTYLSNFTDNLGARGYTALSNFTNDIGAGNQSVPVQGVTYASFNFSDVTLDEGRRESEFITILCNLSLSSANRTHYYVEGVIQNSSGCRGTVNASGSTASYSSNRYRWGSTTEASTATNDGATPRTWTRGITITPKGNYILLGATKHASSGASSCTAGYVANGSSIVTGSFSGNVCTFTTYVQMTQGIEYYISATVSAAASRYNIATCGVVQNTLANQTRGWADGTTATSCYEYETYNIAKAYNQEIFVNLPSKPGTITATALFPVTPSYSSVSNVTYKLIDSDGASQNGLLIESKNAISGIDGSKVFNGNGKLRIQLNSVTDGSPSVTSWAVGLWY